MYLDYRVRIINNGINIKGIWSISPGIIKEAAQSHI